jgi:hypothetical protein
LTIQYTIDFKMTEYVTPADIVKLSLTATALDVAAWRKRLFKYASALKPNGRQYGLLGAVMSPAQYATVLMAGVPPDPFVFSARIPGPFPAAGPAAAQHVWTANDKTCSTEEAAVEKLILYVHDSVDASMLLPLEDPIHGLTTVPLNLIVAHVVQTYGTLTSAQFKALKVYFLRPMRTGATIEEVIAEHETYAQVATAAGMPLSEHDRVTSLQAAVEGNATYAFGLSSWLHAHPEMAQQTFANLKVALISAARAAIVHDPSLGLSAMSSTRHAFSAQTTDVPVAPTQSPVSLPPVFATGLSSVGPASASAPAANGAARTAHSDAYCWYHGNCDHTGDGCDLKDEVKGFQVNATKRNRMGGANGDWKDVKKAILDAGGTVYISAKQRGRAKKST